MDLEKFKQIEAEQADMKPKKQKEHKFKYLNEVIEDSVFLEKLKEEIEAAKNRRIAFTREHGRPKRNAYDELSDKKLLTPDAIRFIYVDILNKRGDHSVRIRRFVELIAGRAVACTIVHYEMPEKEEKEEQR
jgi:hypothetical protein